MALFYLCLIERCIYSATVFPPEALHHTSNRCPLTLWTCLLCPDPSLSPRSPSYCFHSSTSSLNQTVTGGRAALHANTSPAPPPPPPLSARCLFLCSVKRTQCQGPPREFPASGPEPIQLGRSRQCEFFTRLKLSGGQEFTFGAVNVGQGHRQTQTHAQAICSLRPAGRLSYLVGITCIHIDLVTSLSGFGALFPLEI